MKLSLLLVLLLGHPTPYDRQAYRHWIDSDRDCQNTRAEVLLTHSVKPVKFAGPRGCRVVSGVWVDVYSGAVIFNANEIDIDHIIPLGWAHSHGAADWTELQKKSFANDPDNLVPVSLTLNRQKGKKGPDEWRPPSNLCGYATRWLHLLRKYELMLTLKEHDAIEVMQQHCLEIPNPYYE